MPDPARLHISEMRSVTPFAHVLFLLLIIAGPQRMLPQVELQKIRDYLAQGGRMLVLFNCVNLTHGTATGLELLGGGRILAAGEPVRRGGSAAGVVNPGR